MFRSSSDFRIDHRSGILPSRLPGSAALTTDRLTGILQSLRAGYRGVQSSAVLVGRDARSRGRFVRGPGSSWEHDVRILLCGDVFPASHSLLKERLPAEARHDSTRWVPGFDSPLQAANNSLRTLSSLTTIR